MPLNGGIFFSPEQEYNMDIRDRALLYYRLLQLDVNKAKEIICCPRSAQFIDSSNVRTIDLKVTKIGTLSVHIRIYVVFKPLSYLSQNRLSILVVMDKLNGSLWEKNGSVMTCFKYELMF